MTDESTVGRMGFVKDREDKHGADVSSFFPVSLSPVPSLTFSFLRPASNQLTRL